MEDDEDLIIFGTILPQFSEDEIPSKKPITVADQIAVDANGKRRFHGAFTGGFSAGYWNTVGSSEGWKPKQFKSSRSEKFSIQSQAPSDFMDEEDIGEFGIAPHRIQTTEEFTDNTVNRNKTRISLESEGPIRGNPVKELFLAPVKGKICISLLRKMGWKDEDGFRTLTTHTKKRLKSPSPTIVDLPDSGIKVYNCDMGPMQKTSTSYECDEDDSDSDEENIEFEKETINFRINRFGIGYVGLSKYADKPSEQHINLFAHLNEKSRKKVLPISGQAFGVGAFEDEDDDIYAREDFTTYDFTLGEKPTDKPKAIMAAGANRNACKIDGCIAAKSKSRKVLKKIFKIDVSSSFEPTNWLKRKSRFGPMSERNNELLAKIKTTNLNADTRGALIDDLKSKSTEEDRKATMPIDNHSKALPAKKIVDFKKENENKLAEKIAFDRFVSEKDIGQLVEERTPSEQPIQKHEIKMKRTKIHWEPSKILCQKMNVAEPITGYKKSNNKTFLFFENVANANKKQRTELDLIPSKDKEFENESSGIISGITEAQSFVIPEKRGNFLRQPASISSESKTVTSLSEKLPILIPKPIKPIKKTELELRAENEMDKHPSEKKDLFKSIFSDSEDEENETETNPEPVKLTPAEVLGFFETKPISNVEKNINQVSKYTDTSTNTTTTTTTTVTSIINKSSYVKESLEKSISNKSPPRKLLSILNDPLLFRPRSELKRPIEIDNITPESNQKQSRPVDDEIYGPSLPMNIGQKPLISKEALMSKQNDKHQSDSSEDEWIDKSKSKKRKKEKKEKHKKSKKHKKHKR